MVMLRLICRRARETHPVQEVRRSRQVQLSMSVAEKVIIGHGCIVETAASENKPALQPCIFLFAVTHTQPEHCELVTSIVTTKPSKGQSSM